MKLSRITWRVLLATAISTGMAWNALGHADEGSCPHKLRPVCPQAENQCIEKITVIHSEGQQSVTLNRSGTAECSNEPTRAKPDEALAHEADLDNHYRNYEYDYGNTAVADEDEDIASGGKSDENEIDTIEPDENGGLAADPWEEYHAYDEYGYDEYSMDEAVANSDAGERADDENHADARESKETEFNIWGEPIHREVAETQAGQPEGPLEDQASPESVAAGYGADDWDCWYEFEEPVIDAASESAAAESSVEVGGSVRHLKMQALQMVARSFDHAGRTLQVVSADLMRISGENVAQRHTGQRN